MIRFLLLIKKILLAKDLLIVLFLIQLTATVFLYKIYMPRVNAFGCFDDCFNIVAGYFLSKGKILYSQVPFNHQMLMAYMSYGIQNIFHPINIYELILRHRQVLFIFSFFLNALLIFRFRTVGLAFFLFYEFSKFYIFGDRFLAEGFIVYPLVYMTGFAWYTLTKKKTYSIEYYFIALCTWFVVFMREPYTLVALFLFAFSFFGKEVTNNKKWSVLFFLLLCWATFLSIPIKDYFFNIVTANTQTVLAGEVKQNNIFGFGGLKIFFYPLYILFGGEWNVFRYVLSGLNGAFLFGFSFFLFRKRQLKLLIFVFISLGLANFRYVPPGLIFYAVFHMVPWYGMFLMCLFIVQKELYEVQKKIFIVTAVWIISVFLFLLFSPKSFLHEQIDPHEEFMTQYGQYLRTGEVIKLLSKPTNTLFVDGFDELIHWQADRPSPYKYTWYTAFMPAIPRYATARLDMFRQNPPDFYYGSCPKEGNSFRIMPTTVRMKYVQLQSGGKPTCVYIRKEIFSTISIEKWQKAKEWFYELPVEN